MTRSSSSVVDDLAVDASTLHNLDDGYRFGLNCNSRNCAVTIPRAWGPTSLAENYVGLPYEY